MLKVTQNIICLRIPKKTLRKFEKIVKLYPEKFGSISDYIRASAYKRAKELLGEKNEEYETT